MDKKDKNYLDELIKNEDEQIKKLNQIVSESIKEEELLTEDLFQQTETNGSFGQRLADRVASFGGSWKFIILFGSLLVLWITLNTSQLLFRAFDPYPYILLNLILSCIAALQAPVIMMSQNRKDEKDRKRAESDYLVNLKAEVEIRRLHQKVDILMLEQMKSLLEVQKKQLELLDELKRNSK
jgi:uncharacterized membrane protein